MMIDPSSYRSLHDYLDALFLDLDPTDNQIIEAKHAYWKSYNNRLKANKRSRGREFSVWFSIEELSMLKSNIGKLPMTRFIRKCCLNSLYDKDIQEQLNLKELQDQLEIITDYLAVLIELNPHQQ